MASLLLLILFFIFYSQLGVFSYSYTKPNHDYNYMKFVKNADDLPEKEEYDYIIIGGGTAGCPLAATLSSKYSVLVLEKGSDPKSFPFLKNDEGFSHAFIDEDDGVNPFQYFISKDGVENIRARVLGGGSMINNGFYSRAQPEFFIKSGVDWDMEMVEKSYEWVEDILVSKPNLNQWQSIFKKAVLEAGVVPDNGFDLDHIIGTKIGGSTFDSNGIRHGAVELLNKGDLKNLKVAIQANVRRITFFDHGLSANGVIYSDSKGKLHTAFIHEKGEIILSAGAIGSPQILLLSGVGPKSHLSSLKLPVILNQPHVGQFMSDNPRFGVNLILPFPTPTTVVKVVGILKNNTILESVVGSFPFSIPKTFSFLPSQSSSSSVILSLATLAGKFIKVSSFGSLRLASSTNVNKNPIVRFNYLTHPDDLAQCVEGVRKIGDLLDTRTMEEFKTSDLNGNMGFNFLGPSLPENMSDDASVGEFCRKTVMTFWHYHGGCLVGKVVDENYRVVGVKNLRVVDGSTFNVTPGTNPVATVLMLGRYVGIKMLQERDANEMATRDKIATF